MKGFKLKFWIVPLILAIGLFIAGKSGVFTPGKAQNNQAGRDAVHVTAAEARYITKTPKLILTGSIEGNTSAIISAKISGRIAQVLVEDGQKVSTGQALVTLESVELSNAVRMAQDSVRRAQASYDNAKADYNRYKTLFEQNAISKQQLDSAETRLKIAETDLSTAHASLSNARQQYDYAIVAAPVDGVVANKTAVIGQVVSAGMPLMTVEDISSVYAVVNIEQKEIGTIKSGMAADVAVDASPGQTFAGTVEVVNPAAGTSRMFKTKIKISNADLKLKPGMFVKVNIAVGAEVSVLAVPQSAVYQKQGLYYVYVIENNKAVRRQVETGLLIGDMVEIKSGLGAQTKVAASNVNSLKDGDTLVVAQ